MTQLVTTAAPLSPRLQLAVAAWLNAHQGAPLTVRAYRAELQRFCAALASANLTLDSQIAVVRIVAEVFAAGGNVGPVTHNKRLSVLSSFYRYAITHELLAPPNPLDLVKRRRPQRFAHTRALDVADVQARLAMIDRANLVGLRDYMLLSVALTTGRRLAELAGLRWGHVERLSDGRVRITWAHCKGGQVLYDTLPPPIARTLLGYVQRLHGERLADLAHDTPIWVSVSNNHRGGALSVSALADICQRRLGTSRMHRLRHTFALMMEDAGAKVSEIQRRLGHASAATTSIYLQALRADENPYAEQLVRVLGVEG